MLLWFHCNRTDLERLIYLLGPGIMLYVGDTTVNKNIVSVYTELAVCWREKYYNYHMHKYIINSK